MHPEINHIICRYNRFFRVTFPALLLLCIWPSAYTQNLPAYRIEYLMIEDGLPQNTINCMERDHHGFMWFGTNNGLCRYDSYTFEVFQAGGEQGMSLPDNLVRAIAVGDDDRVWIGTGRGLSVYDPMRRRIDFFDDGQWNGEAVSGVTSLLMDGDVLWAGTARKGIFRLEGSDGRMRIERHYSVENDGLGHNQVNVIYRDPGGTVYAGGTETARVLDTVADRFVVPGDSRALPPATFVNDIFGDSRGNLYFSTLNGLFVHDGDGLTWHAPDETDPQALNHGTVNAVREDVSGQILVGTLGGLHLYEPATGIFTAFPSEGHANFILNNEFVSTLYCDTLGTVWIGTEAGGVNRFNVYQHPFMHYTNAPDNPNSLNVNRVNSIYSEGADLWIGTAGGGLNHLDLLGERFTHYTYDAGNERSLSSNFVSALARGSDRTLWVGTWGGGLNAVQTGGERYRIRRINETVAGYSGSGLNAFISTLVDDPAGFLLIGTEGGLYMLHYRTRHFTALTAPVLLGEAMEEIGCALLDSQGYYWIGTRHGLFRFPAASLRTTRDDVLVIDGLEYFGHDPGADGSLPGDYVISLAEDPQGRIWIGTYGYGVVRAENVPEGGCRFSGYTTADGLSNNVVYGIVPDRKGRIWMSTDNGISMLVPETGETRRFYMHDGLLSNQFYWSAAHRNEYGTIFFGGVEGLNYFNPARFHDYDFLPDPKITRFLVHNKEVMPGVEYHRKVVMDRPVYMTDTIRLNYRDNNISFEFSAMDYHLPQKSRYAYMLRGVDQDWVQVSAARRFASYNNLEGGTYTFMLKASNGDGLWSDEPAEVTVIVTPPFWETTWFIAMLVAFFVMLGYGIFRYQLNRVVAQKRLLEEKVQRRTREIEKQKVVLEQQARELMESNRELEERGLKIGQQKEELEAMNEEISRQRDELVVLNEKVNEVNQMQLRFFTTISHEFQTPLTLISGPVERLRRQFAGNREVLQLLKIVDRNAQRLMMLIRQLLEIRKIETGNQNLQVELTDIRSFLEDIFQSFAELAGKNRIDYRSELNLGRSAWVDKVKLENVIYNLLSNAFKFTEPGASISLRASMGQRDGTEYITIAVADTGQGIPPEKLHRLYDRFQQLTASKKQQRAGAGIGLSMAKSLVELMRGTIAVESEPGRGTTFTVELPVSRGVFDADEIDTTGQVYESNIRSRVAVLYDQITAPEPVEYATEEGGVERILVVEDNADMRSFICSGLAPWYRVLEAADGREGLEAAQKELPAVIISDVMMPEMDGVELTTRLKNNLYTSHIPVILLTAKSETEEQVKGLESGADDYVTKPFNSEVLIARVRTLIRNRNRVREKFGRLEALEQEEPGVSPLDRKFYEKAVETVGKHYSDPGFDVDQFASEMLVSRSQLYSKLKAITNLSANEFINTYRLKRSRELLEQGELQISEVAYETGFNDPKYFSRIFRKYYHVKPSDIGRKEK